MVIISGYRIEPIPGIDEVERKELMSWLYNQSGVVYAGQINQVRPHSENPGDLFAVTEFDGHPLAHPSYIELFYKNKSVRLVRVMFSGDQPENLPIKHQ